MSVLPPYHQAIYRYSPTFERHALQPGSDVHELFTPIMTLASPLDPRAYPKVHTTTKASSPQKHCVYWAPFHPSPIAKIYFSDLQLKGEETSWLLIFQLPKKGLYEPFRQLVFAVDDTLPKPALFYQLLAEELLTLPPLESG